MGSALGSAGVRAMGQAAAELTHVRSRCPQQAQHLGLRFGIGLSAVEPALHPLAGLEVDMCSGRDVHLLTGARVPAGARPAFQHAERAEVAQLDAVASLQRPGDAVEDDVYHCRDVSRVEVRIISAVSGNSNIVVSQDMDTRRRVRCTTCTP